MLTISTTIITVQVLQTIPWDKVDIEVLTVETNHAGEIFPGTKQEIREYLAEKGYVHAATVGKGRVPKKNRLFSDIDHISFNTHPPPPKNDI